MSKTDSTDKHVRSDKDRILKLEGDVNRIKSDMNKGDDIMEAHTKAIQDLTLAVSRIELKTSLLMWILAAFAVTYISTAFNPQPIEITIVSEKSASFGTTDRNEIASTHRTD